MEINKFFTQDFSEFLWYNLKVYFLIGINEKNIYIFQYLTEFYNIKYNKDIKND